MKRGFILQRGEFCYRMKSVREEAVTNTANPSSLLKFFPILFPFPCAAIAHEAVIDGRKA